MRTLVNSRLTPDWSSGILLYVIAPLKSASIFPPSLNLLFLSCILVRCPHELLNS